MAGTVSAGTIVYEVDMDTAGILQGRRDIDAALNGLNGSMGRLEAGLNRTERSLSLIEGTMSSLTGVAKALIAALSVRSGLPLMMCRMHPPAIKKPLVRRLLILVNW